MTYPGRVDLSLKLDDPEPITFTCTDNDVPVPLTETVFMMEIRWDGDDGGIVLTTGVDPEFVLEDQDEAATPGQLTLQLSPQQLGRIPNGVVARLRLYRTVDGDTTLDMTGRLVVVRAG